MKKFFYLFLAVTIGAATVACNDDDKDSDGPDAKVSVEKSWVVNRNDGQLMLLDFSQKGKCRLGNGGTAAGMNTGEFLEVASGTCAVTSTDKTSGRIVVNMGEEWGTTEMTYSSLTASSVKFTDGDGETLTASVQEQVKWVTVDLSAVRKVWTVETKQNGKTAIMLYDLREAGKARIGAGGTFYEDEYRLNPGEFYDIIGESAACEIVPHGRTSGYITITVGAGEETEQLLLDYSSLTETTVVLKKDGKDAQQAKVRTAAFDWGEGQPEPGPTDVEAPGGYIWKCETDKGPIYFDFSDFNEEGMDTSVDKDGDYGAYRIATDLSNATSVIMQGRIGYYSDQEKLFWLKDSDDDQNSMWLNWEKTATGFKFTDDDDNSLVYDCTLVTGKGW